MAATGDRPAYAGCFTRTLTAQLRNGMADVPSEHLLCMNVRPLIENHCANQVPEHIALNPDATLWLARNVAKAPEPWAQTSVASEIERLTLAYQPTPALEDIVARSTGQRCVAVVGTAGSGKSAHAAALAWPRVAGGMVPARFVHAIAFITEATTPLDLSRQLCEQLDKATSGAFREAQARFDRTTPFEDKQKLGILEKQLIGPLRLFPAGAELRMVVDALDRLATGARQSVMNALETLSSNAELSFVRLVVTARPDTELPAGSQTFELGPAADKSIEAYLGRRGVPEGRRPEVVNAARGSWLVARLLGDQLVDDPSAASAGTLSDVYDDLLQRCGATNDEDTLRILTLLAAAGAGPVLPLTLLCAASEALGGPSSPARVRDHLVRLRGFVVRDAAGTDREVVGLFHQTLADHVAHRDQCASTNRVADAHRALEEAIANLAPVGSTQRDVEDLIYRYAFEREAEHRWALGEIVNTLQSLFARTSPIPRENLRRWKAWEQRLSDKLGPNHRATLETLLNIATWTGESGDAATALQLLTELLPDYERVLGPDHPNTRTVRDVMALLTEAPSDFESP